MPWIRKPSHPRDRIYWITAILAAVLVGLLIGYERWGTTATLVSIVERELATTEKRVSTLERRIGALENRAAEIMRDGPKLDWQAEAAKITAKPTSRIPSN